MILGFVPMYPTGSSRRIIYQSRCPTGKYPPHQRKEVRRHFQTLLDNKTNREFSSPYASPVVLVRKHDGSMRMCGDYRALNAKTRRDAYPSPG